MYEDKTNHYFSFKLKKIYLIDLDQVLFLFSRTRITISTANEESFRGRKFESISGRVHLRADGAFCAVCSSI